VGLGRAAARWAEEGPGLYAAMPRDSLAIAGELHDLLMMVIGL